MSSPAEKNLIIIDGSYFVFFRYYAIIAWWKIAKKEQTERHHVAKRTNRAASR